MNQTETIKLIAVLSTNYRNWPGDEEKTLDTVLLWQSMLSDVPFEIGQAAVKVHISRSVYPPTIADITDAVAMITSPKTMDAIEAWGMVIDAIRKYGMYRQEEAMTALPADVADMVRRFTWRELCLSEQPDVLRAQWRMAWETQAKRRHEERLIHPDVLQLMESSNAIKRIGR